MKQLGANLSILVRVELGTDWGEVTQVDVGDFKRPDPPLKADNVGHSLHDGKCLLERVQQAIVR